MTASYEKITKQEFEKKNLVLKTLKIYIIF